MPIIIDKPTILYSVGEVAEKLNVPSNRVQTICREGKVKTSCIGKRVYVIDEDAFEELVIIFNKRKAVRGSKERSKEARDQRNQLIGGIWEKNILPFPINCEDHIKLKLLNYIVENNEDIEYLAPRESIVLIERVKKLRNYHDIASDYGVSFERIRQIAKGAFKKILKHRIKWDNEYRDMIEQVENEIIEQKKELERQRIKQEMIELNSSISSLNLSAEPFNALKRAGVDSIEELTNMTLKEVASIRNVGKRRAEEIVNALKERNLSLSKPVMKGEGKQLSYYGGRWNTKF